MEGFAFAYLGAGIGMGLAVVGAGLGIGRLAAGLGEGLARQPSAAAQIIGAVNLPGFLVVIAMTLLTAPLGVKLAHAMDPAPLKKLFGAFLILVALNMLRKAIMG